ncbi:helix-turn-helix domain-containing protein [uncultured Kordia sp.]|uniref:helix-turn-helix domain-containing protein n=1 Tax=uncultured Kordia sp. TaxID=507699 RepID=UPI002605B5FC|nr:helix-turn-helix domain-containing protein [uncultured Kordia sp.]
MKLNFIKKNQFQLQEISFQSFLLLVCFFCYNCENATVDTHLEGKDYNEIDNMFSDAKTQQEKIFFAECFLEKAKNEDNISRTLQAYRMLSVTHADEYVLAYSDSIIAMTIKNPNTYYPAIAYEKKGDFYYQKRAYQRALDNYLEFYNYALKFDQKGMVARANYNLGVVKRRTGNTEEAIELYKKNFVYCQENKEKINARKYLNSITALANIFNDIQQVDSASYYNTFGYNEAVRLKQESYKNHFGFNQGVTQFHRKAYQTAIDSISKYTPYFENVQDDDKLVFMYYYSGEMYAATNQEQQAIEYYKKVDSIFQKTQSIFPITRKAYVRLDNYYKSKNDLENQLIYKNQMIKVDSILKADELYLNKLIFKGYDIPKLKAEKEDILSQKQQQKERFNTIVMILFVFILLLGIGFTIQYRKQKIYQLRFNDAINSSKTKKSSQNQSKKAQKIAVPEDVIENVLQKLETFEAKAVFTSNEITLNSLAKEFTTNPNYLSKIVNHYKKCSFSNYINQLRIEYSIEQLQNNPTYIRYTIKAIAAEVGFNNVQSFSKAFYNLKGIKPSYFIRQLKKANQAS